MLSSISPLAEHPKNIDIQLKKHQLAMLERCLSIEKSNNKFGIMNDKPGTGKTFVILSLIYETIQTNSTNIIVVPQNIYTQWVENIERFSNSLTYLKLINYENILSLYNDPNSFYNYNIILMTSSYYHILSTTLYSLDIFVDRVFFDEIDSISNLISNEINSKFIWFVSASFNTNLLGCYKLNTDLDNIICKCDNNFIDENILLEEPNINYYHCKNIYIDNILENIVSKEELLTLNAMDYSLYKVHNEKEVIETILRNKKQIIDINKLQIEDAQKNIIYYKEFLNNKQKYIDDLTININNIDKIILFKKNIINFILRYNEYADLYINFIYVEDKEADKIIKESRKEQMKKLRLTIDNILDIIYNIKNDFKNNILINKLFVTFESIEEIIEKFKIINSNLLNFYDSFIEAKNNIQKLYESINNNDLSNKSEEQINIYTKILEESELIIVENENKINLLYKRLKENNCCPICYELFKETDKIYITSECCSNKICSICMEEWYNKLLKSSCILCNTSNIYLCNTIFYINSFNNPPEDTFLNSTFYYLENNLSNDSQIDLNNIIKMDISKNDFLDKYINELKDIDKKIIIFSDYSSIFEYIEKICLKYEVNYVDLEKGNILEIDKSIYDYKYGNAKILLSNSSLFGCGMNLENSSEIVFVHKMNKDMENQVIGRAQRIGRKSRLNVIHLLYENESEVNISKKCFNPFIIELNNSNNYIAYNTELPSYNEILDVNLETLIDSLI